MSWTDMTNSFNREILIQEQNKLNTFGAFFKYINPDVPNESITNASLDVEAGDTSPRMPLPTSSIES
jgi:hypothetical protein